MNNSGIFNENTYDENMVKWAISSSNSKFEAIEKLGCSTLSGGGYRTIMKYIKLYNLDISHYTKMKKIIKNITDSDLFCENSICSRKQVKKRYLELYDYKCSACSNIGYHNDLPLTLQLDHINGVNDDNRIINLRLLCPNCHTQTSNYGSKNKKSKLLSKHRVSREQYLINAKAEWIQSQQDRIQILHEANIDFSRYGWVKAVSELLGIHRNKVRKWMVRTVPVMYDMAYSSRRGMVLRQLEAQEVFASS